jgi:hypothetical protein
MTKKCSQHQSRLSMIEGDYTCKTKKMLKKQTHFSLANRDNLEFRLSWEIFL